MKFGISKIFTTMFTVVAALFALASSAISAPAIADLWTAVDITTVNGQVLTLLTAMITIRLAFLVYRYVKRVMGGA